MSLHLEHGTRVTVPDLAAFHALVMTFHQQVRAAAPTAFVHTTARLAYRILDHAVLEETPAAFLKAVRNLYATEPPPDDAPFAQQTVREVVRAIITDHHVTIARTQARDPDFDWTCHLSVIPHATGIYVLVYAESETFHRLWRALPGVTDYAYWNHTDPPDGMNPQAWARRGRRWRDLLGPRGVPSDVGMTLVIFDPLTAAWPSWEALAAEALPAYPDRLRHWAFARAVAARWAQEAPSDRGIQTVWRTHDGLATPEGAAHYAALQADLRALLPPIWPEALLDRPLAALWPLLHTTSGSDRGLR